MKDTSDLFVVEPGARVAGGREGGPADKEREQ